MPSACIRRCVVGHGGMTDGTCVPRRSWLRKSRAERPCCQHVRPTNIMSKCAHAPAHVRQPLGAVPWQES
jgi:hypothetical protein